MVLRLLFIGFISASVFGQKEEVFKITDLVKNNLIAGVELVNEDELIDPASGGVGIIFLKDKNPEIIYGIDRPVYLNSDVPALYNGFYKTLYTDGKIKEIKLMIAGMEIMKAVYFPSGAIKTLSHFNTPFIRDAMNFSMNSLTDAVRRNDFSSLSIFSDEVKRKLHLELISEKKYSLVYKVLKYNENGELELKADVSVDFSYYDVKEVNSNILSRYTISAQNLKNYELIREDTLYTLDEKEFKKMMKMMKSQDVILPKKLSIKDCVLTSNFIYQIKNGDLWVIPLNSAMLSWYRLYVVSNIAEKCPDKSAELKRLTGIDESFYQANKKLDALNYGNYLNLCLTFPQSNGDQLILNFDGKGTLNGPAELYNSANRLKIRGSYLNGMKAGTWSLYDDKFDVKKGIAVFHSDTLNHSQGSVYENDFSSLSATQRLLNKMNMAHLEACFNKKCSEEDYLIQLMTVFK